MSQYTLPFKEGDRVVDIGGGHNPLKIQGVTVFNIDKRQIPGVDAVRNLEEDFSDIGEFDGLYCSYVAEHIGWRKIKQFFKSCYKVLKEGGVSVFVVPNTMEQMKKILGKPKITLSDSEFLFGGQDFPDNVHKIIFSKGFITELLREAGFDDISIYDHPNPDACDMYVEAYRMGEGSLTKINFGSFTVTFGHEWINCDIRDDIRAHVEGKGHSFRHLDVRQRLPWDDGSVDIITAHHLMEHLSREEGAIFLKECFRILRSKGVIRLSTPDLDMFITHHVANDFKKTYAEEFEVKNAEDGVDAFFRLAFMGHKTIYTYSSLHKKVEEAGFIDVKQMPFGNSRSPTIMTETEDSFPDHSLYIEASKLEEVLPPIKELKVKGPVITMEPDLKPYQKYLLEKKWMKETLSSV